ncbi:MAG TPA: hypothetical protein VGT44_06080, partial [Ktedonobacteraceae bacterium]|nr:hypothetical protein [Ktedonobacteraceae bacterium]
FARVGYLMFLRPIPAHERALPFDQWLARHINTERNPELVAFFERISRFALSLELRQVSTDEVVRTTKNMFRYGAPGIVEGGCAALTTELQRRVTGQGASLRLQYDAQQILYKDGQVTGVRARDKTSSAEHILRAPLVVSDLGPRATDALLHNRQITQAEVLKQPTEYQEAIGLKVHLLSDISLIPHKGIMYCLDTQRIAGIVQPTNCDARLAPPGKHLVITHQVMQSSNVEEEKALALADLRSIFGEAFEQHCRVLTISAYRGEWPVNRAAQGEDVNPQTSIAGLYLVGDAVKPSGYLMVEGVAQSVNILLDLLDAVEQGNSDGPLGAPTIRRPRHIVSPPSRLRVLRWLWEAPGNSKTIKSRL